MEYHSPPRFPARNITKNAETHPPPMHDVIIEQPLSELLLEKNLTLKKDNLFIVFEHEITKQLITNLNQISISCVSPGKFAFDKKGIK